MERNLKTKYYVQNRPRPHPRAIKQDKQSMLRWIITYMQTNQAKPGNFMKFNENEGQLASARITHMRFGEVGGSR